MTDPKQGGRHGSARARTASHLPTCLVWLRRALFSSREISEMLCDLG